MSENIFTSAIDLFSQHLKSRIDFDVNFIFNSQESLLVFLFGLAVIKVRPDLSNTIYIDYPLGVTEGSRIKIDIYIDPCCYLEMKYVRPIPSEMNLPLPQHRGTLLNDLVKLATLTPIQSLKYLLLIADENFVKHISRKPGFPLNDKFWEGHIGELVTVKTESNQIKFNFPKDLKVKMRLAKASNINSLYAVLWNISVS